MFDSLYLVTYAPSRSIFQFPPFQTTKEQLQHKGDGTRGMETPSEDGDNGFQNIRMLKIREEKLGYHTIWAK